MKHLSLTLASLLVLTSCAASTGGASTVGYSLSFVNTDAAHQQKLIEASQRVIERRVTTEGAEVKDSKAERVSPTEVRIFTTVSDPTVIPKLSTQLSAPFTFRLMRQANEGEKPDATVEQEGNFKETGITEKELEWITASANPNTEGGMAEIALTPAGQENLKKVLTSAKGKKIGLFVRGRLMSIFPSAGDIQGNIVISGIPSKTVAEIFADDVNVGAHVKFTQVK
jgi:hypothetical protein